MGWPSFETVLGTVMTALAGSADLQAYAGGNLGGAFTVRRLFRQRKSVSAKDLPLLMITSPRREAPESRAQAYPMHNRVRTVRVYAGFVCQDPEAAQQHVLRVDELIEETLLRDASVKDAVHQIKSGGAANDEGFFHPVYFTVADFEIWQRVR